MAKRKNRIGFLLASIHTGTARTLWEPFVRVASHSNNAYYIFPGGKLNALSDSEYLRNSIYSLANSQNVDGLISWSSAIGSEISQQELIRFHENFKDIPFVTIEQKIPGHSCVKFDAYNGMRNLVEHFIKIHGAKKIAFLRGPVVHNSANERYRAYCDVMSESGFAIYGSPLISESFGWFDGEKAIQQLIVDRKLLPGKDFDVLLGASDMMTFSAVKYLQKLGYRTPNDFLCAGFNNSIESRIHDVAFSTVHMPVKELSSKAIEMIDEMLESENPQENVQDFLLSTEIVVRESCGCNITFESLPENIDIPQTEAELIEALGRLFRLDDTNINAVVEPLVGTLLKTKTEKLNELFFPLFRKVLGRFFEQDMDIRLLYRALNLLKRSTLFRPESIKLLENEFLFMVSLVQNRIKETDRYKDYNRTIEMNSLKCELLASRSRIELIEIIQRRFPRLGISAGAIVLTSPEKDSCFVGGFSLDKSYKDEINFPSANLLPSEIEGFDSGVFLVQPLYLEKQPLGYFICTAVPQNGAFFEDLRSVLSSAINAVFMFEEVSVAKKQAEDAERAKTSFFANVGSDLCDPLIELSNKVDQIEKSIANGCTDNDILAAQMVFLKGMISEQLSKTSLVLELTLSQSQELPFEKRIFQVQSVFEGAKDFPLMFGDPQRLKQAVDLFCTEWNVDVSSVVPQKKDKGLYFSIERKKNISTESREQSTVLLAENIILLSGATFERTEKGVNVLFPWANFACDLISGDAPLIEWNADLASPEEWVKIYEMRDKSDFAKSAFLLYTNTKDSDLVSVKSFSAFFDKRLASAVENPVLFVGTSFCSFSQWAAPEQSLLIASMKDFDNAVNRTIPHLVVFDTMDVESVEFVRKNPITELCPVFVLPEHIKDEKNVHRLMQIPRVILCNRSIALSNEFAERARQIISGEEILPPDTGALVKKAVSYLNINAGTQISRWKLADSVHVSEDYLTRIFHKETGLSPWEYLTQYRLYLASQMLLHTNATVYEVAEKCGFQDQAYFCRVFKKKHGIPPGKYRSRS